MIAQSSVFSNNDCNNVLKLAVVDQKHKIKTIYLLI